MPQSNPATCTPTQPEHPQLPDTPPDPPAPNLRVLPRVGASFTTGPGVGYESSFGGVEGFVPLFQQSGQNLAFLQGRVLLSTEDARLGGNAVLGYRSYSRQDNRILGGYLSYDVRDTGNSTFNQVGLGLESLGEFIDFRANGYIPIGDTRQQTGESSFSSTSFQSQAPNFQGNRLAIGSLNRLTQINRRFEAAMSGFDAEAGVRIAGIGETGDLRGYGGVYYYDAPGATGVVGIRGRLEARPTDNFQVGLSVQSDDRFGTNIVLAVSTNFPGTRPRGTRRPDEVVARLGEGVTRQENIVVDRQSESRLNRTSSPVFATNPTTNQLYLFQHVRLGSAGGNGTFENPFGIVQNALGATGSDGNDIVYVQPGTNPGIPAFRIPDSVQVLSTGVRQVIPTVQRGNVRLPLSGAGGLPTILPSGSSNVPGVTLGNNTTLSGFAINNATDVGIGNETVASSGLNPISNVIIRDNQIVGSGAAGILLANVTGAIDLFNNTVTNSGVLPSGGDGILITNTGGQANVTISGNNQITQNNGNGLSFLTGNNAQITPTISGNTFSGNTVAGISFDLDSAQLNNVRISENTTSGNGAGVNNNGDGIRFNLTGTASANNITITGNQISTNTGIGIPILLRNNSQATVTVSGNTISGNLISSNPSAGFGLFADLRDNSILRLSIDSNQISNNQLSGIGLATRETAQATVTVSRNTISGSLGSSNPASGLGIAAVSRDTSTMRLSIDSNQVSNNESSGVVLQSGESSNFSSTVSNNTLTSNGTNPVSNPLAGFRGNFVAQSGGDNSRMCLNLASNTSITPSPAGNDFNFFINSNPATQFSFSAGGNTPAAINFLEFASSVLADPARFTPLGNCVVP